ncbi:MAG: HNH endonuclease signature motif containing protein [Dichotomicrobium sp.]
MAEPEITTAPLPLGTIRKHIAYCPESGSLTRLTDSGRRKAGEVCGYLSNGYIKTSILGVEFSAHRLAWFFMTGRYPSRSVDIDHINRDKADNRWCNLRVINRSWNMQNTDHHSGKARGVSWCKRTGKWQAGIKVNYKRIFPGRFSRHEDAVEAYEYARGCLHLGYVDPAELRADQAPTPNRDGV